MKGQVTMELDDYTAIVRELENVKNENERLENQMIGQGHSVEKILVGLCRKYYNYFDYDTKTKRFDIREYYQREVLGLGVSLEHIEFMKDWLLADKIRAEKADEKDDEEE